MRYCCIHEKFTSDHYQVSKAASNWPLPFFNIHNRKFIHVIERHDDDFTTLNSGHFIISDSGQEGRLIVADGANLVEDYTMNYEPTRIVLQATNVVINLISPQK